MPVVPNPFPPVTVTPLDREAMYGGLISAGHPTEWARSQADTLPETDGALQMLARHRLAERERAAGIAEGWKSPLRPGSDARLLGHQEAAPAIARAIRNTEG